MLVTLRDWRVKGSRLLKTITFDLSKYLNLRVTFDVFICNRMIKLKMASKRSELNCNNEVTTLETWALGKYMLACNSDDYSLVRFLKCQSPSRNLPHDLYSHKLWDNSKCICVSGTIVSTGLYYFAKRNETKSGQMK